MEVSKDCTFFVTCGADGTLNIYGEKLNLGDRLQELKSEINLLEYISKFALSFTKSLLKLLKTKLRTEKRLLKN